MSDTRTWVHTTRIQLRWGDMDALGHVNNTLYFRYMEHARVEWMERLLETTGAFPGQGQVIVNASCTFFAPLTYPGEVEVKMYLGPPGRASVESFYELIKDARKYAEGAAKIVWIDHRTQRSHRLPSALTAAIWPSNPTHSRS